MGIPTFVLIHPKKGHIMTVQVKSKQETMEKARGSGNGLAILKEYQTPVDSRKRVTIRGNAAAYYNVVQYDNGVIVMEPRELVRPDSISERSLEMIYSSAQNLQEGKVSDDFDLDEALALFENVDD